MRIVVLASFNKTEQEAIILNAVCGLIDEMVNYGMFVKCETFENSNVMFQTTAHARLFNIWLCDFLSVPLGKKGKFPFGFTEVPSDEPTSMKSYLFYLFEVCEDSKFGRVSDSLFDAANDFKVWLEGETVVEKVWLPSIDLKLDMRIVRADALKITGNLAKHNYTRLEGDVKKIGKILENNGHIKTIEECYLLLPEFQEWFFDHAFMYQSTEITELLNNIRWAIHDYLQPEFSRAYEPYYHSGLRANSYKFNVHEEINEPLAKAMYWDLLNLVRRKPIVSKFTASPSFKSELR